MRSTSHDLAIFSLYGCVIAVLTISELIKIKKRQLCFYSQSNLQILATEMYKIKNDLSPLIVTELFEQWCSGEKTLWICNIDYSYISWFLEPAQLPIKKILLYLYFFLRQ